MRVFLDKYNSFLGLQEVGYIQQPELQDNNPIPKKCLLHVPIDIKIEYHNASAESITRGLLNSIILDRCDELPEKSMCSISSTTRQVAKEPLSLLSYNTDIYTYSYPAPSLLTNKDLPDPQPKLFNYKQLQTSLHRVFNNSSFSYGGRFYGGEYQCIPRDCRRDILINGNTTIEADFSAYHISMIYHSNNIPVLADPYDIYNDTIIRNAVKLMVNTALNASSKNGAIISFRNELDGIEIKEYGSRSYKILNEEKRKANIAIKKQLDLHFLHKVDGYLPDLLLKDIVDLPPLAARLPIYRLWVCPYEYRLQDRRGSAKKAYLQEDSCTVCT